MRRHCRQGAAPILLMAAIGMLMPTLAWASAAPLDAPMLRRAVVAVLCLLGGFALCLRGWDRLERRQRWRGVGLVTGGWLLGIGALSLLGLSHDPQTWTWWI
jgi:hypothetical protein